MEELLAGIGVGAAMGLPVFLLLAGIGVARNGFNLITIHKHYHENEKSDK